MTWFDLIVLGILGLSVLFAALRGFAREMTTLAALAIGIAAAWYLAAPIGVLFGAQSTMTIVILFVLMFAIGFVAGLIILNIAVGRFIGHKPGVADRVLGVVFGFARGYLLVGLGFLALAYYFDEDRMPDALTGALTYEFAAGAGAMLENIGLENVTGSGDSPDMPSDDIASSHPFPTPDLLSFARFPAPPSASPSAFMETAS